MSKIFIEKVLTLKYHLLTLVLVGLLTHPLYQKTDVLEIPFAKTTLIDTFNLTLNKTRVNTFHRSKSEITYIGPSKPEIVLNTKAEVHNYDIGREERYFPFAKPGDIRVFIDTNKIIGSPGPALTFPLPPPPTNAKENEFIKISAKSKNVHLRQGFLSYPVFIENLSTDTLQVGYGFHIPINLSSRHRMRKAIGPPFKNTIDMHVAMVFPHLIYRKMIYS